MHDTLVVSVTVAVHVASGLQLTVVGTIFVAMCGTDGVEHIVLSKRLGEGVKVAMDDDGEDEPTGPTGQCGSPTFDEQSESANKNHDN